MLSLGAPISMTLSFNFFVSKCLEIQRLLIIQESSWIHSGPTSSILHYDFPVIYFQHKFSIFVLDDSKVRAKIFPRQPESNSAKVKETLLFSWMAIIWKVSVKRDAENERIGKENQNNLEKVWIFFYKTSTLFQFSQVKILTAQHFLIKSVSPQPAQLDFHLIAIVAHVKKQLLEESY